jgi:hypothetical protein
VVDRVVASVMIKCSSRLVVVPVLVGSQSATQVPRGGVPPVSGSCDKQTTLQFSTAQQYRRPPEGEELFLHPMSTRSTRINKCLPSRTLWTFKCPLSRLLE